ncbi:MAG: AbrB/MazE/SpoVT family DNA-binding domain-containing protein [Proteobacteria bacterium]|nr:AbrB/MazE/SpoVT family DNA-binding domain-containing protein [Pseudomonadota bacterium]
MQALKSFTTSIKSRGQLTIPKQVRNAGQLDEGQVVSIIPVGDSIIITPKRLALDDARREIKKILKSSGHSLEELMKGLKSEREALYRETYDRKRR